MGLVDLQRQRYKEYLAIAGKGWVCVHVRINRSLFATCIDFPSFKGAPLCLIGWTEHDVHYASGNSGEA